MDMQSAGAGAGAGSLFSAILVFFGVKQRFERTEKDIENLNKGTVWRETCAATHKAVDETLTGLKTQLASMDKKIDILLAREDK